MTLCRHKLLEVNTAMKRPARRSVIGRGRQRKFGSVSDTQRVDKREVGMCRTKYRPSTLVEVTPGGAVTYYQLEVRHALSEHGGDRLSEPGATGRYQYDRD